jgi:Transcriptional regulatory protein, C terminal/AAA ATPase domain
MIANRPPEHRPNMPRVQDLLDRHSAGNFAGRRHELHLIQELLTSAGAVVVFVHGIAGIGKSRLLGEFVKRARATGSTVVRLDCRDIEPTQAGLLKELAFATGGASNGSPEEIAARLGGIGHHVIVALDTYEVFRLMDTWLRQVFLPMLPDNVRFMLCGRQAPVTAWMSDPGWQGLFRGVRLESLEPEDAADLLARAGVPYEDVKSLDRICHGHPLALTLAASLLQTGGVVAVSNATGTNVEQRVVEDLSNLFLTDITDHQTRRALEAASVVRRVTLPALGALLPDTSPHDAHERIRALPFVQYDRDGLCIHDAVREAIAANLRANDPQQHRAYRKAAHKFLMAELRNAPPSDFWRLTADLLYVLENPVVREAFFPSGGQDFTVEPARPSDAEAILGIIDRHENPANAELLAKWWNQVPETFHVARDPGGSVAGFYCIFDPGKVPQKLCHEDPLTRAWLDHLEQKPMPRQQRALFVRRWLSAAHGEAPSPVQAACWVDAKRKYLELRPNLRRVYLALHDLAPYADVAVQLGFAVLKESTVQLGGDSFSSAMLDMGAASVDGWLARLVAAELGVEDEGLLDATARQLAFDGKRIGLTKLEFGVMEVLQQRAGQAVPRSSLLEQVWEQDFDGGSNVVDVVIRGLRRKLGEKSELIETVHGVGYRLRRGA